MLKRRTDPQYPSYLFRDLRLNAHGSENPDFVLNHPVYRAAQIFVGNANFGGGSSREAAAIAFDRYGIRCVFVVNFGDIFYNNCVKNGILPVRLPDATTAAIRNQLHGKPGSMLTVDLPEQKIIDVEGIAASAHINGELFKSMAKLDILNVPFKGGAESSTAVAAGHVDMGFPTITASLPMAEAGKIRLLAVTSVRRSGLKPDLPTVSESGLLGYDRSSRNGLMGPSALPKDIVAQLQSAMDKILNHPQAREQLMKLGLEPNYQPGEQFGAYLRNEVAQISQLMKSIAFTQK